MIRGQPDSGRILNRSMRMLAGFIGYKKAEVGSRADFPLGKQ